MTLAWSASATSTLTTGIPPRVADDVVTSAGLGIAAIISSKMIRCSATSPPRSSGASRSSWSRASRCSWLTVCLRFRGSGLRLSEQQLGPVLRGECDRLGDERGGGGIVERRWSLGSVRDRNADLLEELLLARGRAETQQPRRAVRDVPEDVRGVGRHIDRFAGRCNGADAAECELDLAVKNGEHLLEVVTVGRRSAARRDVHVDQRVAPSGVGA